MRARSPPPPRAGGRAPAGEEPDAWNWDARDALRAAINGWERPLDWSSGNRERFTERILPRLGELADERLRQRHGLTRESDPARARAMGAAGRSWVEQRWSWTTIAQTFAQVLEP